MGKYWLQGPERLKLLQKQVESAFKGRRTMKGTRFTEEQIIGILWEHWAGAATADVCRKHGISIATFYKWKVKAFPRCVEGRWRFAERSGA